MFINKKFLAFALMSVLAVTASAQAWNNGYQVQQISSQPQNVQVGVVLDALPVRIERPATTSAQVGGVGAGGLIGALLASGSKHQGAAAVVGGLIGGAVATRESHDELWAQQIVIKVDNGGTIAVVQQVTDYPLAAGDSVYVIGGWSSTRVVRRGQFPVQPQAAQPSQQFLQGNAANGSMR